LKILLTGGTGFVGRHLREALADSYTIVAPPRAELDVTDDAAVDRFLADGRFDAVIHSAVEGGPRVMETTLRGFWNLARNASRVHRLVYFGSGAEYGKHRDLVRIREERVGEETPRDPYGFAKLLCNDITRRSANIVNLRLFGVYGPYEGCKLKFISNAVAKALSGIPLVIRQNVVFDYLWIDDLMRMLPRFLEGERTFPDVNITPHDSIELTAIAALVLRETGAPPQFEVETAGMNHQYTGDNGRLMQALPDFRFTSVEEGIRALVAYYRANPGLIDREILEADEYRRRVATRPAEAVVEKAHS
jgi:nucleoside-diphosphate-sugar epimerase